MATKFGVWAARIRRCDHPQAFVNPRNARVYHGGFVLSGVADRSQPEIAKAAHTHAAPVCRARDSAWPQHGGHALSGSAGARQSIASPIGGDVGDGLGNDDVPPSPQHRAATVRRVPRHRHRRSGQSVRLLGRMPGSTPRRMRRTLAEQDIARLSACRSPACRLPAVTSASDGPQVNVRFVGKTAAAGGLAGQRSAGLGRAPAVSANDRTAPLVPGHRRRAAFCRPARPDCERHFKTAASEPHPTARLCLRRCGALAGDHATSRL